MLTLRALNLSRGRGPEEGGVIAIRKTVRRLGADKRGATAIEYGLILALIAVAAMGGIAQLGGHPVAQHAEPARQRGDAPRSGRCWGWDMPPLGRKRMPPRRRRLEKFFSLITA